MQLARAVAILHRAAAESQILCINTRQMAALVCEHFSNKAEQKQKLQNVTRIR